MKTQKLLKKLLIGSTNPAKIADYQNFIPEYYILSPKDLGINLEVSENDYCLKENSQNKAKAWAAYSGFPTISEDTGFFIPALGNKP